MINLIKLTEQIYNQFLILIKNKLKYEGVEDISSVEFIILYNMGDESLPIRGIIEKGYYNGSNVSYILRKLIKNNYLKEEYSVYDGRSKNIHVGEKGLQLCKIMQPFMQSSPIKEEKYLKDLINLKKEVIKENVRATEND